MRVRQLAQNLHLTFETSHRRATRNVEQLDGYPLTTELIAGAKDLRHPTSASALVEQIAPIDEVPDLHRASVACQPIARQQMRYAWLTHDHQ